MESRVLELYIFNLRYLMHKDDLFVYFFSKRDVLYVSKCL